MDSSPEGLVCAHILLPWHHYAAGACGMPRVDAARPYNCPRANAPPPVARRVLRPHTTTHCAFFCAHRKPQELQATQE